MQETNNTTPYEEISLHFLPNGRPEVEIPTLVEKSKAKVLLIKDKHNDSRIRASLSYPIAQKLKSLGFAYYGIEAPEEVQPILNTLGKGKTVNLYGNPKIGPGSFGDRSFADAIYAMSGAGIRVIALDDDRNFNGGKVSKEERENKLYNNLLELLKDKEARICVLLGGVHGSIGEVDKGVPTVLSKLISNNAPTLVIDLQ